MVGKIAPTKLPPIGMMRSAMRFAVDGVYNFGVQPTMDSTIHSLPTLTALREHVRHTLCLRDHLDLGLAELREARVVRSGRTCGAFFQVRGPRLLRSYAVWASDEKRILYYECKGSRFAETTLVDEPNPGDLEAS